MQYQVVFDAAKVGYKSWPFPAFGLIFVVVGALLVATRKHLPGRWKNHPRASSAFAYFFFGFAVLWTLVAFVGTYRDYSSLVSAKNAGDVQIVEGRVTNFRPMPVTGHSMEKFTVGTNSFEYSDYVVTAGFNNTSSHGGPIREGLPVRITFVGNTIIKLEVAQ
jgi:hypothetical protein